MFKSGFDFLRYGRAHTADGVDVNKLLDE